MSATVKIKQSSNDLEGEEVKILEHKADILEDTEQLVESGSKMND